MRELCGSYAGWTKYKLAVYYAGNYAGSIKQHELIFCAQASWKKNEHYAGTARNQPRNQFPLTTIHCRQAFQEALFLGLSLAEDTMEKEGREGRL